jgi:peptidoglycan/xylan/chitin deacetylase (PgdA/CDA1 family)
VLIDYLSSFGQKTTYFQIGSQILEGYQVTQRQYSEGHEICVHTWSHPDLTTLSDEQIYAELQWTIYIIHATIGQTPKYFRPPYGSIDDRVRTVAATLNLTADLLSITLMYRLLHGVMIPTIGKSGVMKTSPTKELSILSTDLSETARVVKFFLSTNSFKIL